MKKFSLKSATGALFFVAQISQGQILQAYRDQNNDAYVAWIAQEGYTYTLQSSEDMEFWDSESTWTGYGQTVSVLVHENPNNGGGGGGAIPGLPQHDFSVTSYLNGDSLVAWKGADGSPYQLYTTDSYFGVNDPPLFGTEVVDPNGDYKLFLFQSSAPLPPNAASLTLAALPQGEQDKVTLLTSAQQQIVNELAANGGTITQIGAISSNVGNKGFFRLIIGREDTDGDGLYNDIEETFGTNPFEDDTDQDGVTDPWDHANIGHVIISEFMASNDAVIADGKNPPQYEDYIELFNPTPNTVDLSGYYLTCDPTELDEWMIPAGVELVPGESLLIFASNDNVPDAAGNLHTSFKLSASGESVLLVAPDGLTVVDSHLNWGVQRLNASAGWGLDQETGLVSALRYFIEPTPRQLNSFESCTGFTGAPYFHAPGQPLSPKNGGVYSNTVENVVIAPSENNDIIYFTLDGSNPTKESPVYDGTPIQMDSTTIVRAIAIQPGCVPSSIVARSFLFKEDVIGSEGQGNPAVEYQQRPDGYPLWAKNGAANANLFDYAMDPEVIEEHYNTLHSDLSEIPSLSISLPTDHFFGATNGIYAQSGRTNSDSLDPMDNNWRRVASFEYIDPNNPTNYQQETGEITISGASSRNHSTTDKHNMRIIFDAKLSVLGEDKFVFDDAPFSGSAVKKFSQLQLRNPTHDSWLIKWTAAEAARSTSIRETWMRSVHKEMNPASVGAEQPGNLVAHKQWIHLYINGLHWGIYEMTERVDEDFARSYGDAFADYDVVGNGGARDGDMDAYNQLLGLCTTAAANPNDHNAWEAVTDMLDCDNYVDYLLTYFYTNAGDWPGNNWRAIRRRPIDENDQRTHKFKFLVWDAERSFWPSFISSNRNPVNLGSGAATIHSRLLNHPSYKSAWKDRTDIHFHSPSGVYAVNNGVHAAKNSFQTTMDDYVQTIYTESARWGDNRKGSTGTTFTFDDPSAFAGQSDRGDWKRTTEYHRDTLIPDQRDKILTHLVNAGLANPDPQ